ncbi:putative transcription factor interactor and regulator CCHC(Zn) family [Helianthus annuus]|nr:putative transcription factor interactor and regulator CCHC(Zn) family [Helianthus annuus]
MALLNHHPKKSLKKKPPNQIRPTHFGLGRTKSSSVRYSEVAQMRYNHLCPLPRQQKMPGNDSTRALQVPLDLALSPSNPGSPKTRKVPRTMTEFLNDMRAIADDLALVQSPVNEEDLLVHITSQLGEEYKPLVAALKVRVTPISYPELFEELLDFERSLQESAPIAEPILATVNATTRQGRIHRQGSRFDTDSSHGPRAGRFSSNNQQRPNRNSPNAASHQASGGYRSNRGGSYCQFCNIPGHTTQDCRKLSRFLRENNISSPVANVTTAAPTASTAPWLFDTGASNHVTPNTTNLHNLSEYGGPDEIVLGDGSSHGGASHAGGEH